MEWRIEYNNDVGPNDEGYWDWWEVTDGAVTFKTDREDDAKRLRDMLNAYGLSSSANTEHEPRRVSDVGSRPLLACTEPMLQAAMNKAVDNGLLPVADCCEAVANSWKQMRECIDASLQANSVLDRNDPSNNERKS